MSTDNRSRSRSPKTKNVRGSIANFKKIDDLLEVEETDKKKMDY